MTDIELTRLCAEAMGLQTTLPNGYKGVWLGTCAADATQYDPLHDDAQAMQLVKKFNIALGWNNPGWAAFRQDTKKWVENADLNRAICLCVAAMQAK
tara:strand:+ start:44347 stop:44637 length:291 start_codon:yes stop_codon:yes gene_type:complete